MQASRFAVLIGLVAAATLVAGCGGSAKQQAETPSPPATTAPATPPTLPPPPPPSTGPGALQGEATSTATGDIPDNQVFLLFRNAAAGYSLKYPEGWAQSGSAGKVVFRDKNNIVRIVVEKGGPRTAAAITQELKGVKVQTAPRPAALPTGKAFKVVYSSVSPPNPVTGKRVTLTVDRYYLPHGSSEAVVDLGTPVGVDNVDAYRLMIESFRWK